VIGPKRVWKLKFTTVTARSRKVGANLQLEIRCPSCGQLGWRWYASKAWKCKSCASTSYRLPLGVKWQGRLTPIALISKGSNGKPAVYRFKCDCGNETIAPANGCKNSCGCLRRENLVKNRPQPKPPGVAAANNLLNVYRCNARKRKLVFSIDKPTFKALTSAQCFYCGRMPAQVINTKSRIGIYVYNGLDRVDNTKGYTPENVVACCKRCNRAKDNMSQTDFIDMALRIAGRHGPRR